MNYVVFTELYCLYWTIRIRQILRNETNCRCEFSFRLRENSAQNESSVLFVHFWWTINERNDEGNKAKGLKIMMISQEFITRKYLCKTPFCSFFPHCWAWSQANVVIVKYGILLLSFPIINLTFRSSGLRQGLKQTAECHFLFDNETFLVVNGRDFKPGPPTCRIPTALFGWNKAHTRNRQTKQHTKRDMENWNDNRKW